MRLFTIPAEQTAFSTKEVVAITGMTKDALRYYEQQQLIGPVPRNHNNYRQYSRQNLERLQFVATFRQLGLDLKLLSGDGHIPNRARESKNWAHIVLLWKSKSLNYRQLISF